MAATRSDLLEDYSTTAWGNDTTGASVTSHSSSSSDVQTPETLAPTLSSWSDRRLSRVIIVFVCLLFLVSLTGNLTVLYIIGQHLKWRSASNVFISVLSLADLLLALTCLPMLFVSLVTERWVFGHAGCAANVIIARMLGLIAAAMTLLLTIDRHRKVVRLIRTKFDLRRTVAIVGACCVASAALSCPCGVPWDGGTPTNPPHELFHRCTWGSLAAGHRIYDAAVYQTVFFTGPVLCMVYCVLSLARTIRRNAIEVCPPSMHVSQLRFIGEIQTAKTVVVMVIVFAICRLPYSVVAYAGAISPALNGVEITEPAWTLSVQLISWASGAVNPFVYAARNPNVAKILHLDRKAGYVSEEPLPDPSSPGDRQDDKEDATVGSSYRARSASGLIECTSSRTGGLRVIHETSMIGVDLDCGDGSISPEVTSVFVRTAPGGSDPDFRPGFHSVVSPGRSRSMSVPSVFKIVGGRFVARNSLSSVSTTMTNVMI